MALARVKVWNPGDVLTAADLNGEFNNVLNNPITLISPTTGPINFNLQAHTNLLPNAISATSGNTNDVLTVTSSSGTLWVAQAAIPSGVVAPFAGTSSSVPTGWVLCDGSALSRTTFAALFAAIGTNWGSSDGATFKVPDLRGRIAVGAGQGAGLTNRVLSSASGEENHALSVAELAAHTHTASYSFPSGNVGIVTNGVGGFGLPAGAVINSGEGQTITIASQGSGTAHNNMQPYAVLFHIIKT